MKKVFILIAIFAIIYSSTAIGDGFDPEELVYFKTIGRQIAKYMCSHLQEILESFNVTQSDFL